jgi:hypothetical protein
VSADGEGIVDPVFVDHEVTDGFERASFREKGFATLFVFLVGIRICFLFETRQKLFLLEMNFVTGSVYDRIRSCVHFRTGFEPVSFLEQFDN